MESPEARNALYDMKRELDNILRSKQEEKHENSQKILKFTLN